MEDVERGREKEQFCSNRREGGEGAGECVGERERKDRTILQPMAKVDRREWKGGEGAKQNKKLQEKKGELGVRCKRLEVPDTQRLPSWKRRRGMS